MPNLGLTYVYFTLEFIVYPLGLFFLESAVSQALHASWFIYQEKKMFADIAVTHLIYDFMQFLPLNSLYKVWA